MGRRKGAVNYKNNVLIKIVGEILPNGEYGWQAVALLVVVFLAITYLVRCKVTRYCPYEAVLPYLRPILTVDQIFLQNLFSPLQADRAFGTDSCDEVFSCQFTKLDYLFQSYFVGYCGIAQWRVRHLSIWY